MRSVVPVAVLAVALAPPAAAARIPALPRPTGTVSGTVQASWTELVLGDPITRTEAAITFTVSDRLQSPGAAEAWTPQPMPDFVLTELRRNYAYLLRATVAVDAFTRTVDDVCEDGTAVRTTTVVTDVLEPHALLQMTQDPTLDLPARMGVGDLRPVDVVAGSSLAEQEAVAATGIVATRTTGMDCGGTDEDGLSAPRSVDRGAQLHLGELAGAGVVAAIIATGDVSLRVTAGQTLVMDQAQTLLYGGTNPGNESLTGSWAPRLRLAGPLRSQRAVCRLPSSAQMARVHSLRGARRLLRRHGFGDVVFVRPRRRAPTRFSLDAPSTYDFCGVTLGTRRHPVLRARRS